LQGMDDNAVEVVKGYSWPGNVRELISCIRRAVVMADGDTITAENLDVPWREGKKSDPAESGIAISHDTALENDSLIPGIDVKDRNQLPSLDAARREMEESLLQNALNFHDRNIKKTAEHLGVSRVTLYRLMEKYCISTGDEVRH